MSSAHELMHSRRTVKYISFRY